jgi:ribokinase
MVGAVGNDEFKLIALSLLKAGGVILSDVAETSAPTGIAMITVDSRGENQIAVASAANANADPMKLEQSLSPNDILLLQYELPLESVVTAATIAKSKGARVILNAAPAGPIPDRLAALINVLVVNKHEAATIAATMNFTSEPQGFASAYAQRWSETVVVTLGPHGALAASRADVVRVDAPRVKVVDTTAAGDTFVGTLAVLLAEGATLEDAVAHGVAAGSLAIEHPGAQPSIPFRAAIEARVASMGYRVKKTT